MFPTKLKSLFFEAYSHWGIGLVDEPISAFLKKKPKVKWISPATKKSFLADPFGVFYKKKLFIFAEHYIQDKKRGEIVCLQGLKMHSALKINVHASYPYLLQDGGRFFCIPESNLANEAVLYEALDFPNKWKKKAVLIHGERVVDPTLFRHKGLWWIFYTRGDDPHRKLYARYSKNLEGPYKAHALMPLKNDIRSSRPAGTPFVHGGVLYRPAQDCEKSYGSRLVLNKIKMLSPKEFEEELVQIIEPYLDSPYPDGIHTLSKVGEQTLVDGKRTLYRLRGPFEVLRILKKTLWH